MNFIDSHCHLHDSRIIADMPGIGETGIDFMIKSLDRDRQMVVFEHHLMLAREMGRPVNIHIRKAWDATTFLLSSPCFTWSSWIPSSAFSNVLSCPLSACCCLDDRSPGKHPE